MMLANSYVLITVLACVFLFARIAKSDEESCPLTACPQIEYPPSCRVTYFAVQNGQVCQLCDDCIKKTNVKDETGCPIRACNRMHIPADCRRRRYYVFNGRICEDCPQNTCRY
ncbi:uncharacterized protein LOC123528257 [Mercenaria mercenaria]|uniref:uncharacterized protein LOC123528257 n=1 Tax=Mercenaria mercenaria TaxID=6596 RepID=UPI001E1D2763|nr:uncharacterized protein LOC123528257 [Mercenaria mercenaria]